MSYSDSNYCKCKDLKYKVYRDLTNHTFKQRLKVSTVKLCETRDKTKNRTKTPIVGLGFKTLFKTI